MSGIFDGIYSITQGIVQLPTNLIGGFKHLFDGLGSIFNELPNKIKDVLTDIFVPDTDYIEQKTNEFTSLLADKFNIDTSAFESLFTEEKPVEDVYTEYKIAGVGTFNFKLLDTSFLKTGINYFRPLIRGFIILMIFLFNIRQLIGFFGYDAGVVAGRSEYIKSMKEEQKK